MKKSIILALAVIVASSCTKTLVNQFQITTGQATNVNSISARLAGQAVSEGRSLAEVNFGILCSTSSDVVYGSAEEFKALKSDSDGKFEVLAENLNPSTTYYYRTFVSKGGHVKCAEVKSFKTTDIKDLSAGGTANCYIVPSAGAYKFKATVKGGSTQSVGTPASAEVLWESFGTKTSPETGDVIKNVSFADGYISFRTPASLKNGNAVIVVKNSSGFYLWTWHIWICEGYAPTKSNQQSYNNSAGVMMDRNIGALSATKGDASANGLYFQWGRKDPFPGGAATSISWPSPVVSTSTTGTIDYVSSHPTTFITVTGTNFDWYYSGGFNSRWPESSSEKGIYDPCPAGWRIPNGGENGVWAKAFDTTKSWETASNWDGANKGMDFATTDKKLGSNGPIWYPGNGYIDSFDGLIKQDSGTVITGICWACSTSADSGYCLKFSSSGSVYSKGMHSRATGASVRCVAQ